MRLRRALSPATSHSAQCRSVTTSTCTSIPRTRRSDPKPWSRPMPPARRVHRGPVRQLRDVDLGHTGPHVVTVRTFALTATSPARIANLVIPPFPTGTSSVFGTITDASTGLPIDGRTRTSTGIRRQRARRRSSGPTAPSTSPGYRAAVSPWALRSGLRDEVLRPARTRRRRIPRQVDGAPPGPYSLTGHFEDAGGDPVADQFFQSRSMPDGTSIGGYSTDASGHAPSTASAQGTTRSSSAGCSTPWVKTSVWSPPAPPRQACST